MIDKHQFPENFNYSVVKYGIDGHKSLLREPKSRKSYSGVPGQGPAAQRRTKNSMTGIEPSPVKKDKDTDDQKIDEISGLVDSMALVPSKVKFGRK